MTEYSHENLSVFGIHEPDYSLEPGPDGNKVKVELPGNYTIGVEVEGAFVPLARFPAGRLFKDIRLAKESGQQQSAETQTSEG